MRFEVEKMTCGHCVATVKKAVEALGVGVKAAVNLEARTVDVTGETDAAKVTKAIETAGYAVRQLAA